MDDLGQGQGQGQGQRGRGSRDTEILEFVADRLVEVHGEDPNTDYIKGLRRIAAKTQAYARVSPRDQYLVTKLDEIMDAVTRIHVLVMIDTAIANGMEIPEEQMKRLRAIVDSFDG